MIIDRVKALSEHPLSPMIKSAVLLCIFLVLTGFVLELDKDIFARDVLSQFNNNLERCTWIGQFYVLFIFLAALIFRYYGLFVAVLLSLIVLIYQSLNICSQPLNSLSSIFIILALGAVAGLYSIKSWDYAIAQDHARIWYDRVRRKHYSKARMQIERDKQLSTLSDYSQRVALCADIEDVIRIGLDITMETMRVDVVGIFALNEDADKLQLRASKGLLCESDTLQKTVNVGEGINGKVAKTNQTIVAYDYQEDFYLVGALKEENVSAVCVVPLISRNKTIGTLTVANRSYRLFSPQEILVLETLGNQLGLAMENAILYDEHKSIRKQLHESEKQYQDIFEKTNDIIWLEDLDGNIISGNIACANVIGVELADLKEQNFFSFVPGEDMAKAVLVRQQLLNGAAFERSYDQTIISLQQTEIILKVTTNLMEFYGVKGFQHIAKDVTEERRMHENLQFYIQHITRAQEEERLRISRELHDSTAQSLIVVLHQLEKYLVSGKHLRLADTRFLYNIVEQVKAILQEVRQFSRDLRPSILDDLGLIPSLEWYIDELNRTHGIKIDLHVRGNKHLLRPEVRVTLFRIIQEGLRNVIRHAEAMSATVTINFFEEDVQVTVQDSGKGFDSSCLGDLLRHGKLGLAGMQERAKLLGGSIEIRSIAGEGTTLYITIPTVAMREDDK